MGLTIYFLICFESHSMEKTHTSFFKPSHESTKTSYTFLGGTIIILLSGYIVKVPSSYPCLYHTGMVQRVFIKHLIVVCGSWCRNLQLFKVKGVSNGWTNAQAMTPFRDQSRGSRKNVQARRWGVEQQKDDSLILYSHGTHEPTAAVLIYTRSTHGWPHQHLIIDGGGATRSHPSLKDYWQLKIVAVPFYLVDQHWRVTITQINNSPLTPGQVSLVKLSGHIQSICESMRTCWEEVFWWERE